MGNSQNDTDDAGVERENLPIYTHTYVLGADIGVRQRSNGTTEVMATGRRSYISTPERRYIAAWARRTLFGGGR